MRRLALLLALLLALVFALPLAAQTELGVHVARASARSTDADGTTLAFDRGRGFGASVEHVAGEHVSYELAATWLRYDGTLRLDPTTSADLGSLKLLPISATARWHFAPRGERVDPYVGAGAAYVLAKDLSSSDLDALGIGRVDVESKACWLANAGVAVGRFFIDGKYFSYRPRSGEGAGRVRLNLRPVVISVGIRWRL
jgi:outer membrane protein W